ncbi:MAG: integrase core domain-containing protein [Beijerinckiaceae bacterium]
MQRLKVTFRHERIDPGQPQQNGRHERFHRTLLEASIQPRPIATRRPDVFGPLPAVTTKSGRTRRSASAHRRVSISRRREHCRDGFPSLVIRPRQRFAR